MRIAVPLVVLCLVLAACDGDHPGGVADPLAPGALARLDFGSGPDTTHYTYLEVRGFPAATDVAGGDVFRAIPTAPGVARSLSLPLDGVTNPLELTVGADGIGATGLPYYRVVAWLAAGPGTAAPTNGAPWATAVGSLSDCSFGCASTCYCGVAAPELELLLAFAQ